MLLRRGFTTSLGELLGSQAALPSPRAELCIALLFSLPFLQQNCSGKWGEAPGASPALYKYLGAEEQHISPPWWKVSLPECSFGYWAVSPRGLLVRAVARSSLKKAGLQLMVSYIRPENCRVELSSLGRHLVEVFHSKHLENESKRNSWGVFPDWTPNVLFEELFFQADLGDGEESFQEIILFAESWKLGEKEDVVQPFLFRYSEVQRSLIFCFCCRKQKMMMTWCRILLPWGHGKGDYCDPCRKKGKKTRGTTKRCFNLRLNLKFLSEAEQGNTPCIPCWQCTAEAWANTHHVRELINKSCGLHLFFVSGHVSAFHCPK